MREHKPFQSESGLEDIGRIASIRRRNNADRLVEKLYRLNSRTAREIMGVKTIILFTIDRASSRLTSRFAVNDIHFDMDINEGISGWVARTGKPAVVNKPRDDHRFYPYFDRKHEIDTKNIMAVPIMDSGDRPIGVLVFTNKKGNFDDEDLELGISLAGQLSVAFENALLYDHLMKTFRSLVEVMAVSIDARHPISSGHSRRVALYSGLIAQEMNLSPDKVELVQLAALLHDYGKISIPDNILKKEGQLSPDEYEIMKEHALSTYEILIHVKFADEMEDIPAIAAMHHERWDGKGYPFEKKGEEIPVGARIIAVADVYDAMTSWREYHNPYTNEMASHEIQSGSGTKFAPAVVEAFMSLYNRGAFEPIR